MNKNSFLLLFILISGSLIGQKDTDVLMTVGDMPVTVSEFKYIYEKNNRDQADYSAESLQEYLDLYTNFKLKVQKAKDLKYDQTKAYQQELGGYRAQLADSYIIDKEVISRMVEQLFQRQKQDVEVEHLLISSARRSNIENQRAAAKKIEDIKRQIDGGMTFDRAVRQYSLDRNTAPTGGNIGFINAPLPEGYFELEDAAYNLEPGEVSDPIRTDLGYHIIRVVSKRPARGEMGVSHILIRNERNKIKLADAEPKINRVYKMITSGELSFEDAVAQFSEDGATKKKKGSLGTFGIGTYEAAFEDAAFALDADGDITPPVETSIGYHIIRRDSKKPLVTRKNLAARLKSQPKTGERFETVHQKVVDEIKKEGSFKDNPTALITWAQQLDPMFFEYKWEAVADADQVLMSFDHKKYSLSDFATYAKRHNKKRMQAKGVMPIVETVQDLYQDFIGEKAIEYAESKLEDNYPEFNNLMREYREGILLFDVTKDYVWDKAAKDTTAIRDYFTAHKEDYQWKDRALVTNYSLTTATPTEVTPILNASRDKTPEEMQAEYNTEKELVLYSQETLEEGSKDLEGMTLRAGYISAPVFKNGIKMTTFKKIEKIIPGRQKTLKEAKGYVISDYQNQLDKAWIQELKDDYKVKINKKILNKLTKG